MARHTRLSAAAAGLLLLTLASFPIAHAQLTSVPDLSTATRTTASSSGASSTASSGSSSSGSSAASTSGSSSSGSASSTTSGGSSASTSGSSSTSVSHLSNLPTIAGASIPTLVVPYTADAPFMQKSSLPEGTVFIVVGAILGFLAFCVIAWRGMVAWTINRSVKKAALASVMASDTKSPWTGKPSGGLYSAAPDGSSLSLDALTSSGKPLNTARHPTARNSRNVLSSTNSGLFFSPTASAAPGAPPMAGLSNRSSTLLPAGYYASPAASHAAGNTTLGSNLGPSGQDRRSRVLNGSPPDSPNAAARRLSNARYSQTNLLAPESRGGSRGNSRPNSALNPGQTLYSQASTSSLAVGTGHGQDADQPPSRAPSAYLEDLFENHGNGPRERF